MRKSWDLVGVSVSIVSGEIALRLSLTALVGNENRKAIHMGSLCFFLGGTLNAQGQILYPTWTQDKQIGGVYKLIFQSNGGIGLALNLQLDHRWDDNTLETFSIFRKYTCQAVAKLEVIYIILLIHMAHFSLEDSQMLGKVLGALIIYDILSWLPYLRRSDLLEITWNSILGPDVLYEKI